MDGLLAWAADVVGAGSDPDSPAALHFTPEQLEQIERLDKRASELQHTLQQLRQRLPPASAAQRLPHLHAESLASQSALALELHAHSATRIQAQIRESSLQSEIAAYTKALAATEQQAVDRACEADELEKSLQDLHQVESSLKEECENLENSLAQRDVSQDSTETETGVLDLLEEIPLEEDTNELQSLKAELAKWQTKVAEVRKELSMVENEALAWPSSAQREKDLERRLRSLTEQLAAKQAQAEKLIIERDALELRVEHAMEARRNRSAGEGLSHTAKRNKIGVKDVAAEERNTRTIPSRGGLGLYTVTASQWRRSLTFRASVVGYVFLLHVVVLVVLSNAQV